GLDLSLRDQGLRSERPNLSLVAVAGWAVSAGGRCRDGSDSGGPSPRPSIGKIAQRAERSDFYPRSVRRPAEGRRVRGGSGWPRLDGPRTSRGPALSRGSSVFTRETEAPIPWTILVTAVRLRLCGAA